MTKTLNIEQMKQAGMPEWVIERITTRCTQGCSAWDKQCNAGMICHITLDREKSPPYGDFEYHFSINFWMGMKKIMMEGVC